MPPLFFYSPQWRHDTAGIDINENVVVPWVLIDPAKRIEEKPYLEETGSVSLTFDYRLEVL
jgi:hypothetical protein